MKINSLMMSAKWAGQSKIDTSRHSHNINIIVMVIYVTISPSTTIIIIVSKRHRETLVLFCF